MRRIVVFAALLLAPFLVRAQNDAHVFTVEADFMTRGELRYGGLTPGVGESEAGDPVWERNQASFILGRTRLGAQYDWRSFSARLEAQHSGTWGGAESDGSIRVREAWVQFTAPFGLFAKVGRQNIAYDDQRIFGNDDWAMTGYSHDILKMGYEGHGHKVHLLAAYNQNPSNMMGGNVYLNGSQSYKAMEALWYHYDIPSWHLGLSGVFLNVCMQNPQLAVDDPPESYQQQLAGAYLSFTPRRWSVEGAYYHQMGRTETGLPVDAWMASGKVSMKPSDAVQLYAGYDYLSGDEEFAIPGQQQTGLIRHEKVKGFNSIFGSHNKFYGAMDFFYVTTYVNGFTPGLQNAYGGLRWNPVPTLSLGASYHFFAIATRLEDVEMPLGHEVELSSSWSFMKNASLSLGYSFMHGTETMELLKRAEGNRNLHWAWLMLTVHPKLQMKN